MLLSMTGYGKSTVIIDNQTLAIHVKSLNSKTLDFFVKLPPFLRDREMEIRNMISKMLERGKIDLVISTEAQSETGMHAINMKLAEYYKEQIRELMFQLQIGPPEDYVSLLLKMPNVLQTTKESLNDDEWNAVKEALKTAIDELIEWRKSEGLSIQDDILKRIQKITATLEKIKQFEKNRRENIRKKLMNDLQSLGNKITIDQNRFEQEIIYYLDRMDISEEIQRAEKHCSYFLEQMFEPVSNGKKLTFASQEILRELNTMSVKANDADIQILAVEMKDEIEKVREQLANIL